MVLHDGETFITKEAPAMLKGLDEQIKVIIVLVIVVRSGTTLSSNFRSYSFYYCSMNECENLEFDPKFEFIFRP